MPRSLSDHIAGYLSEGRFTAAAQLYRQESGCSDTEAIKFVADLLDGYHRSQNVRKIGVGVPQSPIPEYVRKLQELAQANAGKSSEESACGPNILQKLSGYERRDVIAALGQLGKDLLTLSGKVYTDHPAVAFINSGTLLKGGKVYDRVYESLEMVKFAKQRGFTTMPKVIHDWLNRNHERIAKVALKPPPRLLKDKAYRKASRAGMKPKDIELFDIYDAGRQKTWDRLPESLIPFVRMGPGFADERTRLGDMSKRLASMGMSNQAGAILKDCTRFDDIIADQYYKFVRIKLVDAAVIAAKLMGGSWTRSRGSRITISASHFKIPFWRTQRDGAGKLEDDPYLCDVFDGHVHVETNYPQTSRDIQLSYSPRAYPWHNWVSNMKSLDGIKSVFEQLESHPDTNGYPLFDNLWVLVPSVSFARKSTDDFRFFDGKRVHKFFDYWSYARELDKFLVETRQIFPLVVGEVVSLKKCYFIGYWL